MPVPPTPGDLRSAWGRSGHRHASPEVAASHGELEWGGPPGLHHMACRGSSVAPATYGSGLLPHVTRAAVIGHTSLLRLRTGRSHPSLRWWIGTSDAGNEQLFGTSREGSGARELGVTDLNRGPNMAINSIPSPVCPV